MAARKHRRGRLRPTLDALECRALLSTLQVTTTADGGKGSLRYEVGLASAGDTITLAHKLDGKTITLTSGPISLGVDVTIAGPGSNELTVSGGGTQGIFTVPAGVSATIEGLTVANGSASQGAGVDNSGILTLSDDLFTKDVAIAPSGGTAYGGAVFNESGGTLTVTDSTFRDDQAQLRSGNGGAGGAIEDQGTATVTDTTFDSNAAYGGPSRRGVVGAIDVTDGGVLTVDGGTFQGNQALNLDNGGARGGAIQAFGGGAMSVTGSTFRGNTAQYEATTIKLNFASTADNDVYGMLTIV